MNEMSSSNNGDEDSHKTLTASSESVNSLTSQTISIGDLKKAHLNELTELRNQLDEMRTRAMIIETTKQDELDEYQFKSKQEIDSLNHIINALQSDLNALRSDYESMANSFNEYKKQVDTLKSPTSSSSLTNSLASSSNSASSSRISPFNLGLSMSHQAQHYHHNIKQENESLEEDMRKAKESADILRSVVLPLETEISTLRSRSNTNEQRIKELQGLVNEKDKEIRGMIDQEEKFISECLNKSVESEADENSQQNNEFFQKYIQLKKYLQKNEKKFVKLERTHLKALRNVYSMLSNDQKLKLVNPNLKIKSNNKSDASIRSDAETSVSTRNEEDADEMEGESGAGEDGDEMRIEKNKTVAKIEELISSLAVGEENEANKETFTYVELLALYEKEKNCRVDMETNFQQKAKDANKQIENLNREMTNLASLVDELSKQYLSLQSQYKYQQESLTRLNDEIRNDLQQSELKNESFKNEILRLKAENKQFYGDQTLLAKEFDERYQPVPSLDEANRQLAHIRSEMVKQILANQNLNRQHNLSLETVKHLQKINQQYQRSNNAHDQVAIMQSLESELKREQKVRVEVETDLMEARNQLKSVRDKSQTIIDSLKQRNELTEFEIKKLKEENLEFINQIQSLKKDAKNSLSVQEDLVKLIQSLQIELNRMKTAHEPSDSSDTIEVRCQHEDDFNECAACKNSFSVTRRKHRCKHCCKIFCADCCAKTVLSGPNLRPHKVCETCHTLLDKDSRPPAGLD